MNPEELIVYRKDRPREIERVIEADDAPRTEIEKKCYTLSYPEEFDNGRLIRCKNQRYGVSFGLLPCGNIRKSAAVKRKNSVAYYGVTEDLDIEVFPLAKSVRYEITVGNRKFSPNLIYFKLEDLDFLISDDGLDLNLFKREFQGKKLIDEDDRFKPYLRAMTIRSSNVEDRMGAYSSRGITHYLYIFNNEEFCLSLRTDTRWCNSLKREFPLKLYFEICFGEKE